MTVFPGHSVTWSFVEIRICLYTRNVSMTILCNKYCRLEGMARRERHLERPPRVPRRGIRLPMKTNNISFKSEQASTQQYSRTIMENNTAGKPFARASQIRLEILSFFFRQVIPGSQHNVKSAVARGFSGEQQMRTSRGEHG